MVSVDLKCSQCGMNLEKISSPYILGFSAIVQAMTSCHLSNSKEPLADPQFSVITSDPPDMKIQFAAGIVLINSFGTQVNNQSVKG